MTENETAQVMQMNANTVRSLVEAGFTPESAVDAVKRDDLDLLVHSGRFSTYLTPAVTS